MREAFDDAMVTGWEEPEPGIRLPDQDDRHVVAAAVQGGAQGIITANVKDFPAAALKPLDLEAVHLDDFMLDQLDLSPPILLQVIREQAAHSRKPPLTPRDLAPLLGRAGVPDFADEILRLMATPSTAPDTGYGRGRERRLRIVLWCR